VSRRVHMSQGYMEHGKVIHSIFERGPYVSRHVHMPQGYVEHGA
jgi:hypothetical protein